MSPCLGLLMIGLLLPGDYMETKDLEATKDQKRKEG